MFEDSHLKNSLQRFALSRQNKAAAFFLKALGNNLLQNRYLKEEKEC